MNRNTDNLGGLAMAELHDEFYACTVFDADGSRIGAVSQVYLDDATGEPLFVAARTGLFGNKEVLVPLVGSFTADGQLQVPQPADAIKQAPPPPADRRLSPTQEAQTYRHYGLVFAAAPDSAAQPTDRPAEGSTTQ